MLGWLALLTSAEAFCGFYVGGAGQDLYNDATMTVMVRDGTKTVLSMQNSYLGPLEDFALVVPVPEVLDEEDVRALPHALFDKVDALAAPRLVEYWESNPCNLRGRGTVLTKDFLTRVPSGRSYQSTTQMADGVTIEAQFEVAEYDILILSAKESAGLDRWLRSEGYRMPDGSEAALRPYVAQGTKFFVAKIDPDRVDFEDGRAMLSPLRMSYDSKQFTLPIRLGLLNSAGEQDLLVHILAKERRYEVANMNNVRIPTNLTVPANVNEDFGTFYKDLFEDTLRENPGAVVTEYSWNAGTCDPCPGPALSSADLTMLGVPRHDANSWTLTRMHARFAADGVDEDLVFAAAEPIRGGRGMPNRWGLLARGTISSESFNMFQGRYAILHAWEGDVRCDDPYYGLWSSYQP